jgi:hypothetical protein
VAAALALAPAAAARAWLLQALLALRQLLAEGGWGPEADVAVSAALVAATLQVAARRRQEAHGQVQVGLWVVSFWSGRRFVDRFKTTALAWPAVSL